MVHVPARIGRVLKCGLRNDSSFHHRSACPGIVEDVPCAVAVILGKAILLPLENSKPNTSATAGRPMESFTALSPKKLTHPSMGNRMFKVFCHESRLPTTANFYLQDPLLYFKRGVWPSMNRRISSA
jgi:hypothetical protein